MPIKVVVGIIINSENQVLITKRPLHVDHGGLWEFPGGKVEHAEEPYHALVREIKEEVDLLVLDAQLLTEINYQYTLKAVRLLVYHISKFQGLASCQESQIDLQWVNLKELSNYTFPEANQAIIDFLC